MFDRDADIIRAVERREGKRHFTEYPVKYTFYYKDQRGKYKSIYGDPLSRIVCKNTKDFRKEVAINSCLLYTSPSPRDATLSRMPSSA